MTASGSLVAAMLASLALAVPANAQVQADAKLVAVANEAIRVGVDLHRGGAIAWLGDAGSDRNLVNVHDAGRYVQQSYYAGPKAFGESHPAWKDWPWNPIGAGDVYGHRAQVLDHRANDEADTLYVKTRPMQWALNNVPGDCTFETWIRLDGPVAHVRCRLTNARADRTLYPPRDQELPAVYTIADLHRLVTYTGDRPFTGGTLTRIDRVGIPWNDWRATEHWAACVGDDDRGVGVVHPGVVRFIGGFNVPPGRGGALDDATGYLSPLRSESIDADIVYEYDFDLVVGAIDAIRAHARARRPPLAATFDFASTRAHWTAHRADDAGLSPDGWVVRLPRSDPQLLSGEGVWSADATPELVFRAAFTGDDPVVRVYFQRLADEGFAEERSVTFAAKGDGELRDYRVRLADHAEYRGLIVRYRIDPGEGGAKEASIRLRSISVP